LKTLISYGCTSVGLDLNPLLLQKAKSRLPASLLVVGDATSMPFRRNIFDFILCSDVLEHIPEDRKTLKEIYSVLSKGGMGAFTVPIDVERPWVWIIRRWFGLDKRFWMSFYSHVREGYRFETFNSLLSMTGFSIEKVAYCYGVFSNLTESFVIGIMKKSFETPKRIRSFNMGLPQKLLIIIYRMISPFLLAIAYLDFLIPNKNLKSDIVVISRK